MVEWPSSISLPWVFIRGQRRPQGPPRTACRRAPAARPPPRRLRGPPVAAYRRAPSAQPPPRRSPSSDDRQQAPAEEATEA
eukprot:7310861-Karenia_brevis.AAC.1